MCGLPKVGVGSGREDSGFTLLELLIAMTLLSFGLALLFGSLSLGGRAWETAADRVGTVSDHQVVHRLMRDHLSRVFPLVLGDYTTLAGSPKNELRYAFEGRPDRIAFAAFMPPYPDVGGLYLIAFQASGGADGTQLRLLRSLHTTDVDEMEIDDPDESVLLSEAPHAMAFSYYGPSEANQELAWQDRWVDRDDFPMLVRFAIGPMEEAAEIWPDLIVRLAINMDAACIAPSGVGKCRLVE